MKDGRVPDFVDGVTVKVNDVVANWQEGLIGWAVAQLPSKKAKQMGYEAGRCMGTIGYDHIGGGPKTYYAAADPSRFKKGGIGTSWFYPSIRYAATEAARRGDPDAEKLKLAADQMLTNLRQARLEDGVFAPYHRWTAIPEQ